MNVWLTIRLLLVLVVLAAAVWLGLKEGTDGLRDAETVGQRIAASCQVLYGATATLSIITLLGRARLARLFLLGWLASVTMTATMAPIVWGGSDWRAAALAGGSTLIIALLVVWAAFPHLQTRRPGSGQAEVSA